jgi:hypothetical protein
MRDIAIFSKTEPVLKSQKAMNKHSKFKVLNQYERDALFKKYLIIINMNTPEMFRGS